MENKKAASFKRRFHAAEIQKLQTRVSFSRQTGFGFQKSTAAMRLYPPPPFGCLKQSTVPKGQVYGPISHPCVLQLGWDKIITS